MFLVVLLASFIRFWRRRRFLLGRWLPYLVLSAVLVILLINVRVFSYSEKFILKSGEISNSEILGSEISASFVSSGRIPVAIILGASVYSDGALSPLLEERAKTALELYKSGSVKKILVSGDNRVPSYNEVIPIRAYLIENGVPAENIFADFAGFNTYDSVYRAREIFGAENVLIVTQDFHLPRAIYAGRKIGLNAYGVPAGRSSGNRNLSERNSNAPVFKNEIRETFATVKTFFEVTARVKPHFLGRQIPIEGDGRESLR